MGQNSSKRRSYTPGQDSNSELPESDVATPNAKVNGDVKANGSIEVHEEEIDVTTPTSPTSVTSAASGTSSGKKEKRKKLRFIGFSLKRTPSGRWSRKRRNNAANGTARPVSMPDPIRETLDDSTIRPQSFILEELDITEADDNKIETVDLSDHEQETKPKSKSDEKQAPKAPERNKGKRGSQKKGSKKKKEKKSSKKDKQKKNKKPAPEPNVAASVSAAASSVATEAASSAEAKTEEVIAQAKESSPVAVPEIKVQEVIQSATAAVALKAPSAASPVTTSPESSDQVDVKAPSPSSEENTGLEAVASSIVSESVAMAKRRLFDESLPDDDKAAEVSSPGEVAASIEAEASVSGNADGNASAEVDVEEIPPPQSFADTQDTDVSLVDEVINAINAEPIEAMLPSLTKEPEQVTAGVNVAVESPPDVNAVTDSNDGIEIPDKPIVANIVSGIEQDIASSSVSPSFVAKVDISEDVAGNEDTSAAEETCGDAQASIEADTSISKEATEAVAVAEQAEAELQAIVASSNTESPIPIEEPKIEMQTDVVLEAINSPSAPAVAGNTGVIDEVDSFVEKAVDEKDAVVEKITEAAVDVPTEVAVDLPLEMAVDVPEASASAIGTAVSETEKPAVKKSVSDSDSEKARKAELEKEKKEKERLERERLKKQKEEEKAKEKERIKQEKKKKAEQKAAEKAEKAEKEKNKEKKSIVPKRLSQLFHKKEKPKVVAEFEVKADDVSTATEVKQEASEANPQPSPTELGAAASIEQGVNLSVSSVEREENEPEPIRPSVEAEVNPSLAIDVSVEPLASAELYSENLSSPSSPSSESFTQSASESAPGSPTSDTHEQVSDGGSSEASSGVLKKISIGPRLRTAILRKKSSGASDSGHNVSLTTPKVVENADITPPPRKLGPRRPKEQYSPITPGAHNPSSSKEPDSPLRAKSEEAKASEEEVSDVAKVEESKIEEAKSEDTSAVSKTVSEIVIPDELAKATEDYGNQLIGSMTSSVTVDSQEQIKSIPSTDNSIENEIVPEASVGSSVENESPESNNPFSVNIDAVKLVTDNKDTIVEKVSEVLQTESPEKDAMSSDVISGNATEKEDSSEKTEIVEEVMSVVQQVSAQCAPSSEKSQTAPVSEIQSSVVLETQDLSPVGDVSIDTDIVSEENSLPNSKEEVSNVVEELVEAAVLRVQESAPEPAIVQKVKQPETDHTTKENELSPNAISQELASSFTDAVENAIGKDDENKDEAQDDVSEDEDGVIIASPTLVSTATIILRPSLTDDTSSSIAKEVAEEVNEAVVKTSDEADDSSAFVEEQPETSAVVEDEVSASTTYTVKCAAQTVVDTAVLPVVDVSEVIQEENKEPSTTETSDKGPSSTTDTVSQLVAQASSVIVNTSESMSNDSAEDVQKDDSSEAPEVDASSDDAPSNGVIEKVGEVAKEVVVVVKERFDEPKGTTIAEYRIGLSEEEKEKADVDETISSSSDDSDVTPTPSSIGANSVEKMDKLGDDLEKTITAAGDENANEISSSANEISSSAKISSSVSEITSSVATEASIRSNGCSDIDVELNGHQNGVVDVGEKPDNGVISVSLNDSAIEKDLEEDGGHDAPEKEGIVNGTREVDHKTEATTETIEAYLKLQSYDKSAEKGGDKICVANGGAEEAATKPDSLIPNHPTPVLDQAKMTG